MKASDVKKGQRVKLSTDQRSHEITSAYLGASGRLVLDLKRIADGQRVDELAERCEVI